MRRRSICVLAGVAAALALAPAGAQARTACASETAAPTSSNEAQVSAAIFCITNQLRPTYGLAALNRDARLDAAAQGHSQDMGNQNYFSHTSLDGRTPGDRIAAQGYTPWAGENIAAGQGSARQVMVAWMGSQGHCRGILSSARDIGVGTAVVASSTYRTYYTQDFGSSSAVGFNPAPANGCPYTINLDTVPRLTSFKLSPRKFRAGKRSKVSFKLSEAATVRFRVERGKAGRKVNGSCAALTQANRNAKRCTRYVLLSGKIKRSGKEGANSFKYLGRLNGKRLKPGPYRLRAVATGDSGSSAVKRAGFRLKRP